jgi:hypothetical protein
MKFAKGARLALVSVSIIAISMMLTGTSYAADASNVVGMWLFDDNTGDVAKDSSGNGNDGAIADGKWGAGKFGTAVEFDGAKTLVSVDIDSIDVGKNQSFVAWFKTDLVKNIHAQVFHADFATKFRFWVWIMRSEHGAGGKLGFGYRNGGQVGLEMTSPAKLNDGTWHHMVGAFDGGAKLATLYIDGVQAAQKTTAETVFHASEGNLCIGGHCGGSVNSLWLGAIDEVAVLDVALNEADAKSIMDKGLEAALGMTAAVGPTGKLATIWGEVKTQ